MRRRAWLAGAGLIGLAAGAPALAQEAPEVSEVVVTAAPYAVSPESLTASVEVLTREQLASQPRATLGDVLNGLPGLRSSAYAAGASRPIIRGLSGPRVLVLQNGVGQIDASDVSPDHQVASDPAEASRIEVLRGPSTIAYGGSGIGGVVNVIDERIPTHAPGGGFDANLAAEASSVDDGWSLSGLVEAGKGPWVVTADANRRRSEDYGTPVAPLSDRLAAALGVTAAPRKRQANSFVELDTYGAGLSYVASGGFLGASIKKLDTTYGIPYAQILGEPPGGDEGPVELHLKQTRIDVRGEADIHLGPFERIRAAGAWADYEHAEVGQFTGEVGTVFSSDGEEGRIELVQREMDGWKGAVGVQGLIRDIQAVGEEATIPPTRVKEVGAFTLQHLDKGGWGLEGGVRLDSRSLTTPDEERAFTNVSGAVGAFWKPTDRWFVSLNLAHNERAPTEVELFSFGPHPGTNAFEVGDPTLDAETVDSAEAAVRWKSEDLRIEARAYTARYDGYIDEVPTGEVEDGLPVFAFTPTDARFKGVEVEGDWTFWRDGERSLALNGAYDYVRGTGEAGPLARIPPWSASGRLTYSDARLGAHVEVRHVAEQDRVSAFELATDDYTLISAYVSWKPFADKAVRLFADGRNLTDAEAREHASFLKDIAPQAGRNVRVGLTASF